MKLEIEITDDFLDAIATAVVKKFKAEGGTVKAKAEEAEADAPKGKAPAKKAAPKDKKGPTRDEVLTTARAVGEKFGKPAAKAIIGEYAPAIGDVDEDKLAELHEKLKAKLEGSAETVEDDDL